MPWGPTVHIWVYFKISFDVKDISLYKPPFQEMYKYVLIRIVHNSMKSVILPPWHLLNEIQTEVSEVRRCSDLSLVQKMEQEVRGRSRCIIFCRCPPWPPCIEWGGFKAGFWCGRSRKKFQCACQGPVSLVEVFLVFSVAGPCVSWGVSVFAAEEDGASKKLEAEAGCKKIKACTSKPIQHIDPAFSILLNQTFIKFGSIFYPKTWLLAHPS